jgi:hypothetical protein
MESLPKMTKAPQDNRRGALSLQYDNGMPRNPSHVGLRKAAQTRDLLSANQVARTFIAWTQPYRLGSLGAEQTCRT